MFQEGREVNDPCCIPMRQGFVEVNVGQDTMERLETVYAPMRHGPAVLLGGGRVGLCVDRVRQCGVLESLGNTQTEISVWEVVLHWILLDL